MSDFVVPEDFAVWKKNNPTPEQQVEYFKSHRKTKIPHKMWQEFYCVTTEHMGFHCGSCLSDEEYLGMPNFDDKCCCISAKPTNQDNSGVSNG